MQKAKLTEKQLGLRKTSHGCYQLRIGLRSSQRECLDYISLGLSTDDLATAQHSAICVLKALKIAGYKLKKSQECAVDLIEIDPHTARL